MRKQCRSFRVIANICLPSAAQISCITCFYLEYKHGQNATLMQDVHIVKTEKMRSFCKLNFYPIKFWL